MKLLILLLATFFLNSCGTNYALVRKQSCEFITNDFDKCEVVE